MLKEFSCEFIILRQLILILLDSGIHAACDHCGLSHIVASYHGLVKNYGAVYRHILLYLLAFLPTSLQEQFVKNFLGVVDIHLPSHHFDDVLGEHSQLAHRRALGCRSRRLHEINPAVYLIVDTLLEFANFLDYLLYSLTHLCFRCMLSSTK